MRGGDSTLNELGRLLKFVSATPGIPSGDVKWSMLCPTCQKYTSSEKNNEQATHSNIRFPSLEPTHPSSFHSPLWSTAPKSLTDIFSRLWTGEEYKLHNVFRNYVASTYFLLSSTILAITRGLHIVIEGIPYSSISSESPSITIQSNSVLPWQVAPNFIPVYFRLYVTELKKKKEKIQQNWCFHRSPSPIQTPLNYCSPDSMQPSTLYRPY